MFMSNIHVNITSNYYSLDMFQSILQILIYIMAANLVHVNLKPLKYLWFVLEYENKLLMVERSSISLLVFFIIFACFASFVG